MIAIRALWGDKDSANMVSLDLIEWLVLAEASARSPWIDEGRWIADR